MRSLPHLSILLAFIAVAYLNQKNITNDLPIDSSESVSSNSSKNNPEIIKKTPKAYDKPSEAAAWMASMRQAPKGFSPAELNLLYGEEIKSQKALKTNQNLPAMKFEELGPGIFGGRIRGFVMHPEREGHLLAGGVSGGIWKSIDDGASWEGKTDFLESIAIGSMFLDPDNPERVFMGTGEGFFNFDAARGNGIFVSEDFGETWTQLPSTTNQDFFYVNRLTRIPNSDVLLAATATGIFRSTDLGSTWTEVSGINTAGRGFTDLQLDPSNSNHLLAYHFGNENVRNIDLSVSSPANIAGTYEAISANFGPNLPNNGLAGELVAVVDNNDPVIDGCESITNDVSGKVALIERGGCNFTNKVSNAQDAGAVGVIVYQNTDDDAFAMGGSDDSISIPAFMVSKFVGERLFTATAPVNISLNFNANVVIDRFIHRSLDGGNTWTKLDDNGLPEVDVLRMEIGFGADGKTYIAASKDAEELENGGTNGTLGLWRSTGPDNRNFEKTASDTNFIERQGWYDMAIAVNPDDSDDVIIGAIDLYATKNAGDNITRTTYWFSRTGFIPQYIHADHHGYFYSPFNSEHIYVVSDGGVAKSEDGGETFVAKNGGLYISQSYGIAVSPDGKRITSGTQDNGSQIYFGDQYAWLEWAGGDGGFSGWDQQQPNFIYGSRPNGSLFGSDDGGLSSVIMELPDTDGARFIQPFELDENNGNRMLVGTDNVFYTNNARSLGNATWVDVTDTINGAPVSALAFNPYQNNVAYAGMSGSSATGTNQIIKITGLGSANEVTDVGPSPTLGVAGAVVTDIKVDIHDSSGNTVYATFGNYDNNRILRSTNGGSSWSSIANNLPDIPLFQVINDPTDTNTLYVGSELGLWVGVKSGNTYNWEQFDFGPAFTRVLDLVWRNDELFIGTHGRGTYKASKNAIEVSLVKFIGDNSSCDTDNFLDRGESGELIVAVKNLSAKNLSSVNLEFELPSMISFANANQTIALDGFSTKQISVPVTLNSDASCLAQLNVPVTVTTATNSYTTSIELLTAANTEFAVAGTFNDGAESADSQLKSVLAYGNDGWVRATDSVNSGGHSWFTTNEGAYSDKSLVTPWLTFSGGGNVLSFALSYDTEGSAAQYWDGLVLEMRTQDSDLWFDIGHLSSVPYDGQLSTNNTAQGQFAWSGTSLAWQQATVNLGTEYTGKTAKIRWRMISDTNTQQDGVWVDDIAISNVLVESPPTCDACISDGESLVPNKGLWYDPAYDGHGFIVEAFGANDLYFTMFYTFDDDGNPEWYNSLTTLENGVLNPDFEAESMLRSSYNFDVVPSEQDPLIIDSSFDDRLSINFNNEVARNHPACQDNNPRRNINFSALATWKLGNITRNWCIEPLISNQARPEPDFGTGWWAGNDDNGWGYSLAQVNDVMIAYIFYYDAAGQPRWATGSAAGFAAGKDIVIQMNDVFGYGRTQNMVERTFVENGTITLNLSNTFRNLDTDGTTSIDITYQGDEGGRWFRDNVKIMNLVQEH